MWDLEQSLYLRVSHAGTFLSAKTLNHDMFLNSKVSWNQEKIEESHSNSIAWTDDQKETEVLTHPLVSIFIVKDESQQKDWASKTMREMKPEMGEQKKLSGL